jgi:peptidoglycan/LPS O-acetylase OafA/YrhL
MSDASMTTPARRNRAAQAVAVSLRSIHTALSRVTSSGRFIPAVDGLRCIAILSVVFYHLNDYLLAKSDAFSAQDARQSWLHLVLSCGGCGVQLFFVISGFVLGLPFAEQHLRAGRKVRLRDYFARRLLRIEPPYLINLAIAFVLLMLVKGATFQSLGEHLVASLFYAHNLVFGEASKINVVAWSLEIEVQFYILAPLLAAIFAMRSPRIRRAVLVGCILGIIGWKLAFIDWGRRIAPLTVFSYLDFFLTGFLLVDIYVADWNQRPAQHYAWDLVAVVAWCSVVAVHGHPLALRFLPLVVFVAFVSAFRGSLSSRLICQPWLVTIGGMCYTIYLYHFFLISALGRFTVTLTAGSSYYGNLLLQALLLVPFVLAASGVLFLAFEKPFMIRDWPMRLRKLVLAPGRLT